LLNYPLFCTTIFSTLQAQSLFKQVAISLPFLPCNSSHSKQAAVIFSFLVYLPADFSLLSSVRSECFLICFFISLLYIKPLFPINKLLSINSFLDWKGQSRLSCSPHHQFPPYAILLQTYLTRYCWLSKSCGRKNAVGKLPYGKAGLWKTCVAPLSASYSTQYHYAIAINLEWTKAKYFQCPKNFQ